MLFQRTALRLSRNSRVLFVAMIRWRNTGPSKYTYRLARLTNRDKIEEEGEAPIWIHVDEDVAQQSTEPVGASDDVDNYRGLTLVTLRDMLKRRGMRNSAKRGISLATLTERLQKSDQGPVPQSWLTATNRPYQPRVAIDVSSSSPSAFDRMTYDELVEELRARKMKTSWARKTKEEMLHRLQTVAVGSAYPWTQLLTCKAGSPIPTPWRESFTRDPKLQQIPELRRLLRENGLAGYWRNQNRAQMFERLAAVQSGEVIPEEWKPKEHLGRRYSVALPPEGDVFADMNAVEIDALMKFRGLHYQRIVKSEKIKRLMAVEAAAEPIPEEWLSVGMSRERAATRQQVPTAVLKQRIRNVTSAAAKGGVKAEKQATTVGRDEAYSPLAAFDEEDALPAQTIPAVAQRAADYDRLYTYSEVRGMCQLEGLRVQAPGLQKRRLNIRKDVLCYRLAASELDTASPSWFVSEEELRDVKRQFPTRSRSKVVSMAWVAIGTDTDKFSLLTHVANEQSYSHKQRQIQEATLAFNKIMERPRNDQAAGLSEPDTAPGTESTDGSRPPDVSSAPAPVDYSSNLMTDLLRLARERGIQPTKESMVAKLIERDNTLGKFERVEQAGGDQRQAELHDLLGNRQKLARKLRHLGIPEFTKEELVELLVQYDRGRAVEATPCESTRLPP